jgi:hypothetical protein
MLLLRRNTLNRNCCCLGAATAAVHYYSGASATATSRSVASAAVVWRTSIEKLKAASEATQLKNTASPPHDAMRTSSTLSDVATALEVVCALDHSSEASSGSDAPTAKQCIEMLAQCFLLRKSNVAQLRLVTRQCLRLLAAGASGERAVDASCGASRMILARGVALACEEDFLVNDDKAVRGGFDETLCNGLAALVGIARREGLAESLTLAPVCAPRVVGLLSAVTETGPENLQRALANFAIDAYRTFGSSAPPSKDPKAKLVLTIGATAALIESAAKLMELRAKMVGASKGDNERRCPDVINMMVCSRFIVATPDASERSKLKTYAVSSESLPAPLRIITALQRQHKALSAVNVAEARHGMQSSRTAIIERSTLGVVATNVLNVILNTCFAGCSDVELVLEIAEAAVLMGLSVAPVKTRIARAIVSFELEHQCRAFRLCSMAKSPLVNLLPVVIVTMNRTISSTAAPATLLQALRLRIPDVVRTSVAARGTELLEKALQSDDVLSEVDLRSWIAIAREIGATVDDAAPAPSKADDKDKTEIAGTPKRDVAKRFRVVLREMVQRPTQPVSTALLIEAFAAALIDVEVLRSKLPDVLPADTLRTLDAGTLARTTHCLSTLPAAASLRTETYRRLTDSLQRGLLQSDGETKPPLAAATLRVIRGSVKTPEEAVALGEIIHASTRLGDGLAGFTATEVNRELLLSTIRIAMLKKLHAALQPLLVLLCDLLERDPTWQLEASKNDTDIVKAAMIISCNNVPASADGVLIVESLAYVATRLPGTAGTIVLAAEKVLPLVAPTDSVRFATALGLIPAARWVAVRAQVPLLRRLPADATAAAAMAGALDAIMGSGPGAADRVCRFLDDLAQSVAASLHTGDTTAVTDMNFLTALLQTLPMARVSPLIEARIAAVVVARSDELGLREVHRCLNGYRHKSRSHMLLAGLRPCALRLIASDGSGSVAARLAPLLAATFVGDDELWRAVIAATAQSPDWSAIIRSSVWEAGVPHLLSTTDTSA